MANVIIIDDQSTTLKLLAQLVKSIDLPDHPPTIRVTTFLESTKALSWIKYNTPDLVLIDYKMPNLNGIEFIKLFRRTEDCESVPVVMITAYDEKEIRYKALDAGASDFLSKPIDHHECRARCKNLLELRSFQIKLEKQNYVLQYKVNSSMHAIIERERETLLRLARAGEYRDEETGNHIFRIAKYSNLIAKLIGLDGNHCDLIEQAAPMHDVGKIGISDSILLKQDRLTNDEFDRMKSHTLIGYEILKDSPSKYLQTGASIALGHHEHYDGCGYPYAVRGEEIPIEARIVAVADVFDALTSVRPYKDAWSIEDSISYIRDQKGGQFDPVCVDVFIDHSDKIIHIYNEFKDVSKQNRIVDLQSCKQSEH